MKKYCLIILIINLFRINDVFAQFIHDSTHEISSIYKFTTKIQSPVLKDSITNVVESKKNKPIGLKNPYIAAVLAIFPGAIVRGIGHFYAEKYITGGLLIIITFLGIYFNNIDYYETDPVYKQIQDNPPRYVAEIYKHKHHELLYYSSTLFIFGSWPYDIIGAPIVCIRHNKRIKQKLSLNPYFAKNQLGNQIGIQLRYSF